MRVDRALYNLSLDANTRRVSTFELVISISDMHSMQAAQLLTLKNETEFHAPRVPVMNFANAQNGGGGYQYGANTQEESFCRQCPTLWFNLHQCAYIHRTVKKCYPFGHEGDMLYSPNIPCVRASTPAMGPMDETEYFNVNVDSAPAPDCKKGETPDVARL